jgi:hypothetical protein
MQYVFIKLVIVSVSRLYIVDDMTIVEHEAAGETNTGSGNRNTRKRPPPVPPCLPQIRDNLYWDRTWEAVVRNQRLTA